MDSVNWIAIKHDLKSPDFDMKKAISGLNKADKYTLLELMKFTLNKERIDLQAGQISKTGNEY